MKYSSHPTRCFLILSLLFLFFVKNSVAQEFENVRSYITYKTNVAMDIDGKAEEESWKDAPWTEHFIDIEGVKKPKYETRLKMLWDKDYLYFYARMKEPHIWGTLKQRDTVIFYNNDFEIFIDPDGDTHNYYEFEVNALNTVWDLFIVKPYREPAPIIDKWNIQGLKSAVHIEGTLNNPEDKDTAWSVEVAIPWKVLKEADSKPNIPVGDYWRINFSRVNWDFQLKENSYSRKMDEKGNYSPEYNWVWSPQGVINMHEPERWGYVYFSPKIAGNKETFKIPETEEIKWFLYKLYRKHKTYYSRHGEWFKDLSKINEKLVYKNRFLEPQIEFHKTGWNIFINMPESSKTYCVTQDGDFIILAKP